MRIDIISLFPDVFLSFMEQSIVHRSQEKGHVQLHLHQLRNYSTDKHQAVDDYAYGGAAGMVLMAEPIVRCIEELTAQRKYDAIIYVTPDGDLFNQPMANNLSMMENIIILCGRYKGIDQRVRDHWITHEISIGDYVLTGGELAAAVICDAIVRLIPGVLNDESSALTDSFQDGLLDNPVYTRPANFRGYTVPEVLTGGDHRAIDEWNHNQSLLKTQNRRPDLLLD